MEIFDSILGIQYHTVRMVKSRLTAKELEAMRQIRNWLVHRGRTPSVRELMTELGYKSPRSAQDIIEKLEEKGYLKRKDGGTIQLIKDPDLGSTHAQTLNVPLVGMVACGSPIFAEENIEAMIPVSTSLVKKSAKYFILRAVGNSMDLAGIEDGDLVLVRQQETAEDGDKVVALIDDSATIKEFYKRSEVVVLKPKSSNPIHTPIILSEDFRIQGVVTNVIPNL